MKIFLSQLIAATIILSLANIIVHSLGITNPSYILFIGSAFGMIALIAMMEIREFIEN